MVAPAAAITNLLFWPSFPEQRLDDGHSCEAGALDTAAGHRVRDVGLRDVSKVPALEDEGSGLCGSHDVCKCKLRR